MTVKLPKGWYDISVPIKQDMVYFPTDPAPPRIYRYSDRALGKLAIEHSLTRW
jgi:kynurenine formamidase